MGTRFSFTQKCVAICFQKQTCQPPRFWRYSPTFFHSVLLKEVSRLAGMLKSYFKNNITTDFSDTRRAFTRGRESTKTVKNGAKSKTIIVEGINSRCRRFYLLLFAVLVQSFNAMMAVVAAHALMLSLAIDRDRRIQQTLARDSVFPIARRVFRV